MHEKAHIFFLLLNRLYKIDAAEKLELISIAMIPHMKKGDASSIISGYQRASNDIIDTTERKDDFSALKQLSKNLKQK